MWAPIRGRERVLQAMETFPAWLEIDLERLRFNLASIRQRVGVDVMPVVKNNAYGHGLLPITQCLYRQGVRWFLVAKLFEAELIRRHFPESRVLCMDALFGERAYDRVVERGITPALTGMETARRLSEAAVRNRMRCSVFIKVDTGLRRVGVPHEEAAKFIAAVARLRGLHIAGVFSSFMQHPEEDRRMLARFEAVIDAVRGRGIQVPIRTMASTNAIFHQPEAWLDMVRPAMCLLGVRPFPADRGVDLPLEQVLELKARVELVKTVEAGDSVTYFGAFTAPERMRIGTLHLGFYDALPRELANKLRVRVGNDVRAGIGTISLNHCLIDLSGTDAKEGDVVTVIARDGENSLVETASAAGWMVYSLMNHLSPYLPRVYLDGAEPVAVLDPTQLVSG